MFVHRSTLFYHFPVGQLCADTLLQNQAEFEPFCEYNDDATTHSPYVQYVASVRNDSHCWGGHLEIRVLSKALHRTIFIYTAANEEPIVVDYYENDNNNQNDPIRLSYHLHYYALGEHYNEVIPLK